MGHGRAYGWNRTQTITSSFYGWQFCELDYMPLLMSRFWLITTRTGSLPTASAGYPPGTQETAQLDFYFTVRASCAQSISEICIKSVVT